MFLRHVFIVSALLVAVPAFAEDVPVAAQFEERLHVLELRQAELHQILEEKKTSKLTATLGEHLTCAGLLEIEGRVQRHQDRDGRTAADSDVTLATAQFGVEARLNDHAGGTLIVLSEEDGPLAVDVATIDLSFGGAAVRVGRQYLPFGVFYSHFVSDPLTQALGETRATAVRGDYLGERLNLSVFAFNGSSDQAGSEDHVSDGGLSLAVMPLPGLELGGSYLSDLAESNAALLAAPSSRRIAGWSAFFHLAHGPLSIEGECLAARRRFAAVDLDADADGRGDRPLAWSAEVAYRPVLPLAVALRCEGSAEFAGRPQRQSGAALSWSPWADASFALEYLHGEFAAGFGADRKRREQIATRLALAF